ncbi:hypothetical protein TNCV_814031 [Trichonephila clavipes]|nr:hypothetical protein TNCV_814031 [Trichonephila clavipes]
MLSEVLLLQTLTAHHANMKTLSHVIFNVHQPLYTTDRLYHQDSNLRLDNAVHEFVNMTVRLSWPHNYIIKQKEAFGTHMHVGFDSHKPKQSFYSSFTFSKFKINSDSALLRYLPEPIKKSEENR